MKKIQEISFYKEKQKLESLTLIYIITLGASQTFDGFWEKFIQLGQFGMLTKSSSSLLEGLGIEHIIDHSNSWMNIISKSLCASKIVLVSKLFLQTFWEKILISFIIIPEYYSWLSKLTCFYYPGFSDTSSSAILY